MVRLTENFTRYAQLIEQAQEQHAPPADAEVLDDVIARAAVVMGRAASRIRRRPDLATAKGTEAEPAVQRLDVRT
jgi:hypothetical protein